MSYSSVQSKRAMRAIGKRVEELPVLPLVISRLLTLDAHSDDYFDEVLALIESEPNFALRTINTANSANYASNGVVSSLRSALTKMGSRTVVEQILAYSVTKIFVPKNPWEKSLWRHSLQVACGTRALLAKLPATKIDLGEAYLCALLHDIGRFILFSEAPEELRKVDESDWENGESLVEAEKGICGYSHCELGALVCQKWGLPTAVVDCIAKHHSPISQEDSQPTLRAYISFVDIALFPFSDPEFVLDDGDEEQFATHIDTLIDILPSLSTIPTTSILRAALRQAEDSCRSLGLA